MVAVTDVHSDPGLSAIERETVIHWSAADDMAHVASEEPAVIRWLLDHPEYEETRSRSDSDGQTFSKGRLPVGCVKLSGESRSDNRHSRVLGQLPEVPTDE